MIDAVRDASPAASAGFIGRVVDAARDFAALLWEGIARVVRGAPAVLAIAIGCNAAEDEISKPAPPPVPHVQTPPAAVFGPSARPLASEGPKQIGLFTITFYYMIGEDEIGTKPPAVANENSAGSISEPGQLAAIAPDAVTLYTTDSKTGECTPIAEVSHEFAAQLALQGSGKLKDGRVLNIWGRCRCDRTPCFKVIPNQWGTAGSGHPLQPFRTVAVDPKVVKLGTLLYVPLLEGRTMPGRAPWGGFVHDGCVVADDTGGFGGQKLDLFVGRKAYFVGLGASGSQTHHAWAKHVPVFDGSKICERRGARVAKKSGAI